MYLYILLQGSLCLDKVQCYGRRHHVTLARQSARPAATPPSDGSASSPRPEASPGSHGGPGSGRQAPRPSQQPPSAPSPQQPPSGRLRARAPRQQRAPAAPAARSALVCTLLRRSQWPCDWHPAASRPRRAPTPAPRPRPPRPQARRDPSRPSGTQRPWRRRRLRRRPGRWSDPAVRA